MSSVITTSETTTSLFSTPTTTPLTSNSSSSTLQKSKQKSLGKRLWVVGRGNNRQKTRLFLLDENGCQRKYSSEDAAMQRLWRPNSIAVGENKSKEIIEEEKTQEDEDEDLLWLRNQKIPKRYEETMPKDNYNLKRPTIEFAPVKAESENNESIDENENNNKLNNKQQNNLLNILLSTTAKPTTKIIKYTTINNNEDSSLQEELNEIINSVERSGEINNLKRPFENNKNNINNKNQHFSSLYEEEEIRPVEIPFEPLPLPISEIPIWKRPPPGEDFNNFNLPPPPPPPLPIKFSLQANVKSTSHILPEIS
uniref:Uncharacterized protein n=1 Tax=Meloidogyne hapla TaxID=6305 RepID=A0A1I8B3P5_MELHA